MQPTVRNAMHVLEYMSVQFQHFFFKERTTVSIYYLFCVFLTNISSVLLMIWRMPHSNGNNGKAFSTEGILSLHLCCWFCYSLPFAILRGFFTLLMYKRHTRVTCTISFGMGENANHTNTRWHSHNCLNNTIVYCDYYTAQ